MSRALHWLAFLQTQGPSRCLRFELRAAPHLERSISLPEVKRQPAIVNKSSSILRKILVAGTRRSSAVRTDSVLHSAGQRNEQCCSSATQNVDLSVGRGLDCSAKCHFFLLLDLRRRQECYRRLWTEGLVTFISGGLLGGSFPHIS